MFIKVLAFLAGSVPRCLLLRKDRFGCHSCSWGSGTRSFSSPNSNSIMSSVPRDEIGLASGTLGTVNIGRTVRRGRRPGRGRGGEHAGRRVRRVSGGSVASGRTAQLFVTGMHYAFPGGPPLRDRNPHVPGPCEDQRRHRPRPCEPASENGTGPARRQGCGHRRESYIACGGLRWTGSNQQLASSIRHDKRQGGNRQGCSQRVKTFKYVDKVYEVYGVYDIVAEVAASSMEELKETVNSDMRKLKNVLATNTIIVTGT